ncbi:hypothetical protein DERF_014740 [Dermatophagoides farinae]|uniref:Uncharacterized protein n=1 Tax=Dermatophagoides farinae TaxID=6954 RepID=A0A922HMY3_DERFA|nr:hypothetical protein HUG17_6489 [Dermatophagoides farinae]KAH9494017.1 hypothetical protein DERF_014740 [Dermatophagoides farinae]
MEVKWIITIIKRLSNFSQEISQKYWTDNAERPVESTNNNAYRSAVAIVIIFAICFTLIEIGRLILYHRYNLHSSIDEQTDLS